MAEFVAKPQRIEARRFDGGFEAALRMKDWFESRLREGGRLTLFTWKTDFVGPMLILGAADLVYDLRAGDYLRDMGSGVFQRWTEDEFEALFDAAPAPEDELVDYDEALERYRNRAESIQETDRPKGVPT